MNQQSLFDHHPGLRTTEDPQRLARRSHPETSAEAADKLIESGGFGRNALLALETVADFPRQTSAELDRLAGCERREVGKRLAGLAEQGLVARCERRKCLAGGNQAVTWILTPAGQQEIDRIRKWRV